MAKMHIKLLCNTCISSRCSCYLIVQRQWPGGPWHHVQLLSNCKLPYLQQPDAAVQMRAALDLEASACASCQAFIQFEAAILTAT